MKNAQSRGSALAKGIIIAVCSLPLLGVAVVGLALLALSQPMADHMCEVGQYPIKAVGGTTGGACQQDGTKPAAGYVSYPQGEVPQYVGDKWDNFWGSVAVNARGQIVDGHGHLASKTGPIAVRNGVVVQGQAHS